MASAACANHACREQVHLEKEYHTCALCNSPAYCSDQCRVIDWPLHACDNLLDAANVAVPYHYEDMLTEEELKTVPISDPIFHSYKSIQAESDMLVIERTIMPLVSVGTAAESKPLKEGVFGRGAPPTSDMKGNFTVRLTYQGETLDVSGNIPNHMIFAGNTKNSTIERLSKFSLGRSSKPSHYVFWPQFNGKSVVCNLRGSMSVQFLINDKEVTTLEVGYRLDPTSDNRTARAVRKVFRSQLEIKHGGKRYSTEDMQVRRYSDHLGNRVDLTFHVQPNSGMAHLIDVEFLLPTPSYIESGIETSEMRIMIDANNLAHMSALCMAADLCLAMPSEEFGPQAQDKLRAVLPTLKAQANYLEENDGSSSGGRGGAPSPAHVQNAIAIAVPTLYEPLGAATGVDYWYKKMSHGPQKIARELLTLIDGMNKARGKEQAGKNALTRAIPRALKFKYNRSLSNFTEALNRLELFATNNGASAETLARYQFFRTVATQAKGDTVGPAMYSRLKGIADGAEENSTAPAVPTRD